MIHYIYLPGLGDRSDPYRQLALRAWRRRDRKVTFVPMHWSDSSETYEQKYQRVQGVIMQASKDEIVLVGESAGAAMALLTFSRHSNQITSLVTVCGYNHGAADVQQGYKRTHPAFYRLMPAVDKVVSKLGTKVNKITTIYSTRDKVVTPEHSQIDGAGAMVIQTPGHIMAIIQSMLCQYPIEITERRSLPDA